MKYIVLGKDGKEYGPVDAETLEKWVEHGRVFKDSKVRNALMMKWNDAGKLDFLADAFKLQEQHEEEESSSITGKIMGFIAGAQEKHEVQQDEDKRTAFRQKYTPKPAGVFQRIGSFAIDTVIIGAFGLILFFVMVISTGTWITVETTDGLASIASLAEKKEFAPLEGREGEVIEIVDLDTLKEAEKSGAQPAPSATPMPTARPAAQQTPDAVQDTEPTPRKQFPPPYQLRRKFNALFTLFAFSVFLYYGISLGIYAQTVGMWYFGLIIVRGHDSEALPARTFAYALLSLVFAPITPFVVLLNPAHRSIQGYLTGTRLISITAKAKN